jgi:hypothetical protein
MEALRNVSGQTLILQEGGRAIHLLPGRAVTIAPEALKTPQMRRLLLRGLVLPEKIGTAPPAVTPAINDRRKGFERNGPKE